MVRTLEEILNNLRDVITDATTDTAISLIEDVTDTITDLDNRVRTGGDWQRRYEENDAEWRRKYSERFFEGPKDEDKDPPEVEETKTYTYEELFKED